jgi:hypothetical protein
VEITNTINYWMAECLPWAILAAVLIVASDLYRLVRLKDKEIEIPRQALAL